MQTRAFDLTTCKTPKPRATHALYFDAPQPGAVRRVPSARRQPPLPVRRPPRRAPLPAPCLGHAHPPAPQSAPSRPCAMAFGRVCTLPVGVWGRWGGGGLPVLNNDRNIPSQFQFPRIPSRSFSAFFLNLPRPHNSPPPLGYVKGEHFLASPSTLTHQDTRIWNPEPGQPKNV